MNGSTACSCLRDERLRRVIADPTCKAPSHTWDACNELEGEPQ